jgi:ribosomal protein L37E
MSEIKQLVCQQPVCAECGSSDIEARASLRWSEQIQDWLISEVFKDGNCANCGNTTAKIRWINP